MNQPQTSRWTEIAIDGRSMSAYLATPPGGKGPGLLLLQEIFGVNAHVRSVAEQYAAAGFVVLAPDVFWRQAPGVELGFEGAERQRGIALATALQADEVAVDLQAAVAALRLRPEVAGARVGAIGYCMGGRLAFTAAALAGVDAAVAYYGGGIQGQLALAPLIGCPLQFHHAGHDDHIPPEAVAAVRQALIGKPAEFHDYPEARHGFNCAARASYHAPSAALALGRSLQFLAQRLF